MSRIYAILAAISLSIMAVTFSLGMSLNGAAWLADETSRWWMRIHFLMGTLSALSVVLVHSIGITYFIGTSRWCKEVASVYELDFERIRATQRLKRRAFAWGGCATLAMIAVVALGAASDPATGIAGSWLTWHRMGAVFGPVFAIASYWAVWRRIVANQAMTGEIVAQIQEIRMAKGLGIDDSTL